MQGQGAGCSREMDVLPHGLGQLGDLQAAAVGGACSSRL
jgi:hypothetical protein